MNTIDWILYYHPCRTGNNYLFITGNYRPNLSLHDIAFSPLLNPF